jgi:hypothetical protein
MRDDDSVSCRLPRGKLGIKRAHEIFPILEGRRPAGGRRLPGTALFLLASVLALDLIDG